MSGLAGCTGVAGLRSASCCRGRFSGRFAAARRRYRFAACGAIGDRAGGFFSLLPGSYRMNTGRAASLLAVEPGKQNRSDLAALGNDRNTHSRGAGCEKMRAILERFPFQERSQVDRLLGYLPGPRTVGFQRIVHCRLLDPAGL